MVSPKNQVLFYQRSQAFMLYGNTPVSGIFSKEGKDYDSLFAFLGDEALPKWSLPLKDGFIFPLTLLHSEWPKLYGVLSVLSAIGLRIDAQL